MPFRRLVLIPLAALIVLAPSCGGEEEAGVSAGASLAPRGTLAFVEVAGNLDADQWQTAMDLLDRFPDGDQLLARLRSELTAEGYDLEADVDPAFGEDVFVVALGRGAGEEPDVVALTQPEDDAALERLMREEEDVETREIRGWTAIGKADALGRYEQALEQGTLEDDERFGDAAESLPDDALVTAYVDGAAVTELAGESFSLGENGKLEWFTLALTAEDDGARLAGAVRATGLGESEEVDGDLLDRVPADALGVVAFGRNDRLAAQIQGTPGLEQFEAMSGIDLEQLFSVLGHGGVLWAQAGTPIPEFTFIVPDATTADVEPLLQRVAALGGGRREDAQLGDAPATRITLGPIALTYGEVDGRLVLTTSRLFEEPDRKLEDSDEFEAVREAAEMPDEVDGFLYLNLQRIVPLLETAAGFADEDVDERVFRNLEPLGSVLAYAASDGDEATYTFFLEIR